MVYTHVLISGYNYRHHMPCMEYMYAHIEPQCSHMCPPIHTDMMCMTLIQMCRCALKIPLYAYTYVAIYTCKSSYSRLNIFM